MIGQNRTLSDSAKIEYMNRSLSQIKSYMKQHRIECIDDIAWEGYITHLSDKRHEVKNGTWRYYKAANAYFFKQNNLPKYAGIIESLSNEGTIQKSDKTTSNKKKFLTEIEENKIKERLLDLAKQDIEYRDLYAVFSTIIFIGIRPAELPSMVFYDTAPDEFKGDSQTVIRISNAKNSNGRTFGDYRYIGVDSFTKAEIALIKYTMQAVKKNVIHNIERIDYQDYYKRLSKRFAKVVKSIWPSKNKNIVLYTCRHQCIANMKKAKYSLPEIAVIVGHGNDVTASEHYGKGRFGRGNNVPKANQNDIKKVKLAYKNPKAKNVVIKTQNVK